jgi:ubiquinone/menaquinone biosynthesis C-methylase UbiE
MPSPEEIYAHEARRYDQLVAREDYQRYLLPSIQQIIPLEGKDVVESGAGTGRLTCLLAPLVKSIHALDASPHMLSVAADKLKASRLHNWSIQAADHRWLPVSDQSADLAISGWSVCYLIDEPSLDWRQEVAKAIAEMRRVLRPGGVAILIETQGTGFETPHPPEHLHDYFRFLAEKGFASTWIRTDYQFVSLAEAIELVEFFFGESLAEQVRRSGELILPECTGLWWQKF